MNMYFSTEENSRSIQISEYDEILPGVKYGRPEQILSPAYWQYRAINTPEALIDFSASNSSLEEELVFCLLGGYGIKLEVAEAYFAKLINHDAVSTQSPPSAQYLEELLREPVLLNGTPVKYRFPKQKSKRISKAIRQLNTLDINENDPLGLRGKLLEIEGVGPKTASWIVRNYLGSDDVAILDIHIMRACWIMNLFPKDSKLPTNYIDLEKTFILFSKSIGVRTSLLDALMWTDMRNIGVNNLVPLKYH